MPKKETTFFCQNCGNETGKWLGQCPVCKEWNSFVEERVAKTNTAVRGNTSIGGNVARPTPLSEIPRDNDERLSTGIGELDRVLGGGLVTGSLVLVGGDPGIGKSTLLLQVCQKLTNEVKSVLYISGEESLRQIKIRADRIGQFTDSLQLLCETNLNTIEDIIRKTVPAVVVIDSIQTMYCEETQSAPGSVSQVRESTTLLLRIAKGLGITIFIVGHVTKEGTVAGPRVLEHIVDTVLYFEGDRHAAYRILRGVKNRFGSTNEIGVFEMQEMGLMEVPNPSEYMLSGKPSGASGSVVACLMEGSRPILIEIQALLYQSSFGIPRRQATGADSNRLNLLIAVLEKRLGLQMGSCDAYVNLAGGLKNAEPALDLGIVLAIVSSFKNCPIDDGLVAFGEVGLSGEVRSVSMSMMRVKEAAKLGFTACMLPEVVLKYCEEEAHRTGIRLIGVKSVADAIAVIV
ncbi:MAG: DNA repair protein RadA [Lachnospiraceae bacterium]|jgi:DNA repair protein RadA/Sms|nr:DNA repair protein RadA [Lachnospiraceae bacterium]